MDQAKKDRDQLKALLDGLANGIVKEHMLKSLAELDAVINKKGSEEQEDALASRLRQCSVVIRHARDALALYVHALMLDTGFYIKETTDAKEDSLQLPCNWEKHLEDGAFECKYVFRKNKAKEFELKALFVENTLIVHIIDAQQSESSMTIEGEKYIHDLSAVNINPADALSNLATLRQEWTIFLTFWLPKDEEPKPQSQRHIPPTPASSLREPVNIYPSIPSVGRGDILPDFGFQGHRDPGMLVGPDHPLFGGPPSFPGTVPGARFDPFGPVGPRPMHPFQPNHPRPAPRMPFGGPDPDHLRVPGDRNPDVDHMFY